MQKHHIFLIHGITDETSIDKDYKELCNLLRKSYKAKTKRIFDEDFELVPIKWDKATLPLSQELFKKSFGELKSADKVLVSSVLSPLEQASGFVSAITNTPDALHRLLKKFDSYRPWRYFSTLYLGDMIAYASKYGNGIRQSIWNEIKVYLDKPEVPPFSIVAHSIGSVAAYDFVKELIDPEGPNLFDLGVGSANTNISKKQLEDIKHSFCNLYTLGSPQPLFLLENKADLINEKGKIDFSNVKNPFFGTTNKWINFVDTDDVTAYPVEALYNGENELEKPANPKDILVKSGWLPQIAHINYWRSKTVAEEIVKAIALEKGTAKVSDKEPATVS